MKIWKLWAMPDDYECVNAVKSLTFEESHSFDGRSKILNWKPIGLKAEDGKLPYGDISSFIPGIPVVSPRVVEVTKDLIQDQVEVLPTICSDCELYILNITNIVDAVDYTKAQVKYFPDGKKVLRFIKLAFIREKVYGNHIFKLTEHKLSSPYVSDEFRQRILDNNLTGFKFELVWDSEAED